MVPLMVGDKAVAWVISGHYFVGEGTAGSRELSDEMIRKITADKSRRNSLKHSYSKIKIIPQVRHKLMVRFLETCTALIGANLNQFLIGDGWEQQERCEAAIDGQLGAALRDGSQGASRDPVTGLGIGSEEIATRTRIEKARRRFLRTLGCDADIEQVGREAGWVDARDFQEAFYECIGESPSEHRRRVTGLWSDFSKILADSGHRHSGV